MKKTICILTATRAEYGLLRPIMEKLSAEPAVDLRIAVTGAHLSADFGLTYQEIEQDGFSIDEKIAILSDQDTPVAVSKAMGQAISGFADYFQRRRPDLLVLLGDRYETLAVAIAAANMNIPIAHLYGGETTEGAVDEAFRHAITKLSYLHFTSTESYRRRVIQLGESPDRVYAVGATGVENILHTALLTKEALEASIGRPLARPFALVTFHPVTLEEGQAEKQTQALLEACRAVEHMDFIFTKANADAGGRAINALIDAYVAENPNGAAYSALGITRYLSALKYCTMVIGNSSSGLIEAPSFGVPTVNIGDRQRGRLQSTSVINCEPTREAILEAMTLAQTEAFIQQARATVNPYGDGNASSKIVSALLEWLSGDLIDLKKTFYDLGVD